MGRTSRNSKGTAALTPLQFKQGMGRLGSIPRKRDRSHPIRMRIKTVSAWSF